VKRKILESPVSDQLVDTLYFDAPSALIEDFLADYNGGPPKTQQFYRDQVGRAFLLYLQGEGVRRIGEVTPQLVRAYLDAQGHLSRKSILHRYMAARTFLQWCVRQGKLTAIVGMDKRGNPTRNPADLVRKPTVPSSMRTGYDKEDTKLLLRAAAPSARNRRDWIGVRNLALLITLIGTGARADELLSMSVDDIDWQHARLLLHGKGERDRYMPMGKKLNTALKDYVRVRPRTPEPALWITMFGNPFDYDALRDMLKDLEERTGVERVQAHRFRHTYAVAHYEANRDVVALQHALAHRSPQTTMTYLQGLGFDFHLRARYPHVDEWLVT
jgi:integrase